MSHLQDHALYALGNHSHLTGTEWQHSSTVLKKLKVLWMTKSIWFWKYLPQIIFRKELFNALDSSTLIRECQRLQAIAIPTRRMLKKQWSSRIDLGIKSEFRPKTFLAKILIEFLCPFRQNQFLEQSFQWIICLFKHDVAIFYIFLYLLSRPRVIGQTNKSKGVDRRGAFNDRSP